MKKRKLIFLLPIAAMALGACGAEKPNDDSGSQQTSGDTISLTIKNKADFELEVGSTKKLEAALKGTRGTLVWSSSDEEVATVSGAGRVTAVAEGEATISVTYGDLIDSVTVTVVPKGQSQDNDDDDDDDDDDIVAITPQEAISLMDQAGDGNVVQQKQKVKGVCASGSKYDSQYNQYTTGFDGVEDFKVQFKDDNHILNGASPDGMEIVVEGYLEKYQGKYQLSYLPASASPTGDKFTPILVSAKSQQHDADLVSISVSSSHRQFYKGQTFVGETVTAHYSDGTSATVTATFSGYDKDVIGEQTISVSYTEKEVTITISYQITVSEKADIGYGTESSPLTVSQALQVIAQDCPNDNTMTAQAITVQGTISEIKNNFTYESGPCFEFNLTDGTNTVYVYRCHCTEAQKESVVVGATVKLVGYAKNFKNTLEFVDNGANQCHIISVGLDVPPVTEKVLESIEIVGALLKTTYTEGQSYSTSGLSIKGHYDDGTEGTVTGTITLNKTTAELGDTQIIANATVGGISATAVTLNVTVNAKTQTQGGAVYTFKSESGQNQALNMKDWTSDKFLEHVEVDGDEIITGMSAPTNAYIGGNGGTGTETWNLWECLKVGKNSAKGEITLLLDDSYSFDSIKINAIGCRDDGTLTINDITKDVTKKATKTDLEPIELEYEISGGISELKLSSKDETSGNYGICITKIEFVGGEPAPQKDVKSISIEGSLAKTSYEEGEAYSANGLSVLATFTDDSTATVKATITFDKTTAALGDTTIIASATYQDKTATKECSVTVTEAQEETLTAIDLGGEYTVVFNSATYENAIKAGSGKKAGEASVSIPAGAKKIIIYAAAWSGETVELSVTGGGVSQTLALTADSGISGSETTFTLTSTTESSFKFEIDLSSFSGSSLTFKASKGKRFVLWNASYTK